MNLKTVLYHCHRDSKHAFLELQNINFRGLTMTFETCNLKVYSYNTMWNNKVKYTLCFLEDQIQKKVFSTSDACFYIRLIQRIQKYGLELNGTSHFSATS